MAEVFDFGEEKAKRSTRVTGKARCRDCTHVWTAEAPSLTQWLECPSCSGGRGRFECVFYPPVFLKCPCGWELFTITPEGLAVCPNCGRQNGTDDMAG